MVPFWWFRSDESVLMAHMFLGLFGRIFGLVGYAQRHSAELRCTCVEYRSTADRAFSTNAPVAFT